MAIEREFKMSRLLWLPLAACLLHACGGEDLPEQEQIELLDLSAAGTLQKRHAAPAATTPTELPAQLPTRDFDARSKPIPIPVSPQDPIPIGLEDNDVPDAGTRPVEPRPRKRRLNPEDLDLETNADRHKG